MRLRQLLRESVPARPAWRDARGWTLLEMVVVMALIVVLAGIATAQHRNAVTRTKEAVLKENLFRMRDAIDQYYADKNRYPSDLQALVSDQYIREVPLDPFTQLQQHLADRARRSRSLESERRGRHLQRQERFARRRRSTARTTPTGAGRAQTERIVCAYAASIRSIDGSRHNSAAGIGSPAGGASSSTSRRCSHVVSCHLPNLKPTRG